VKAFLARAQAEALPKITSSAMVVQIVPDEPDPKVAIELGYTLLLDKPLMLVALPGVTVPAHLARAADVIVPWSDDKQEMQRRVLDAIRQFLGEES
jgi:hypothetical protein